MSFMADTQFDDAGIFDAQTLAAYRAWAFPPALANEQHTPYFALHAPEQWTTLDGLSLFLKSATTDIPIQNTFVSPRALNAQDVAAFARAMLPPHLHALPYFSGAAWISAAAFQAFTAHSLSLRADTVSVNGVARRIKGPKRAGALLSSFVIDLDEDDSDGSDLFEDADAADAGLKRKRTVHLNL